MTQLENGTGTVGGVAVTLGLIGLKLVNGRDVAKRVKIDVTSIVSRRNCGILASIIAQLLRQGGSLT